MDDLQALQEVLFAQIRQIMHHLANGLTALGLRIAGGGAADDGLLVEQAHLNRHTSGSSFSINWMTPLRPSSVTLEKRQPP